jgi:ABC-2 type transport system permease protein
VKGALYVVNAIVYMCVALAITFLVSKISRNPEVISVFSNIISLGMAFLCGIFVPKELMSDGVNKVATCMPAHWYVETVECINNFKADKLGEIVGHMGVQLAFAMVIVVVALVISRRKVYKKSR